MTKSLKLKNGQEIISRIEEKGDFYELNKPVVLAVTQQGVGFVPFMISTDDETFQINKNEILVISKTTREIEDQYIQSVSGLSVASSSQNISKFSI